MNFLAHLYLADPNAGARIGNLIADSVKGHEALAQLPESIQRGVIQHREVDRYTDSHPVVMRSRKRFSPRWNRVSGILIDVYFDHCLAIEWKTYCEVPLRDFLDASYPQLLSASEVLPDHLQNMMQRLVSEDLLMTYAKLSGIECALGRISTRLRNGQFQLHESLPEFVELLPDFQDDFKEFFRDIIQHTRRMSEILPQARINAVLEADLIP